MRRLFGSLIAALSLITTVPASASSWQYPQCAKRPWLPLSQEEIRSRGYEPVVKEVAETARSILAQTELTFVVSIVDCPNARGQEVFIEGIHTAARAISTPELPEFMYTAPDLVLMVSYRYIEDMPLWSLLDEVIMNACSWVSLEHAFRDPKHPWSLDQYRVGTLTCVIRDAEKRKDREKAAWYGLWLKPS